MLMIFNRPKNFAASRRNRVPYKGENWSISVDGDIETHPGKNEMPRGDDH